MKKTKSAETNDLTPETFIEAYSNGLATQNWKNLAPIIAENACVTFSDGTVLIGKENVQTAFERNFSLIKSEHYAISQVRWLKKEKEYAVYLFEFSWSGIVNDQLMNGGGHGTTVVILENGQWKLLTEHLGRKPK